jgi:hypothetical protein
MKGLKPFLYLLLGYLLCAILSGCAGSVPQDGPSALVISQINLAQGVPGVAYKQLLIASGGKTPYTWTVSAGSLPPGLSLTTDGVLSGTPTTTGTFNFTVQVVDSQAPTAAVSTSAFAITINPPLSLASIPLATGVVGGAYGQSVIAANGVQPYGYAVAFGSLPPCSPNPPCTNGVMTLTTNPPPMGGGANNATISTPAGGTLSDAGVFNFTIQATDAIGEVATATFSIAVTGRLQGNYALTFNGFEKDQAGHYQPVYLAGSFVANGNNQITSGVMDQAGPGSASFTNVPLTGTYNIPTGSNIANINLISGLGTYGLSASLSTTSDSSFIMTNSTIWGSGQLKKQSTFSLPANVSSYAFGLFGSDTVGNRYAGAGMFQVSSLIISGGAEDTNDSGTPSGELPINGGSMSSPNGNTGRGTMTLNVNGQSYNYAYYTISPLSNQLVGVEIDNAGPQTLVTLLPQEAGGVTGGGFSNNNLTCQGPGACVVVQTTGLTSAGPEATVGTATFDGNGNITRHGLDSLPGYFTDESDGGTVSQNSYNGTYSVDATCGSINSACGRVTVNLTNNGQPIPNQPVWYLVTKNQAFIVGTDPAVSSGQFSPQSGAPFTDASLLGAYLGGTINPASHYVTNEVDVAGTPPPGGTWAVVYDTNGLAGLQSNQAFSGPYAIDPTYGAKFGRFEVTTSSGQPVTVLYIAGSGSAGATGGKAGLVGLNVGQYNGSADPNPRLTQLGR